MRTSTLENIIFCALLLLTFLSMLYCFLYVIFDEMDDNDKEDK